MQQAGRRRPTTRRFPCDEKIPRRAAKHLSRACRGARRTVQPCTSEETSCSALRSSPALACSPCLRSRGAPASAQVDKPVRLLVGFAPAARPTSRRALIADRMKDELKQPVRGREPPRRAAAGSSPRRSKNAPADGSVLMLTPIVVTGARAAGVLRSCRTTRSPTSRRSRRSPTSSSRSRSTPAIRRRTCKELVAWYKANPAKANFGSPAPGSLPHFFGVMIGEGRRRRADPRALQRRRADDERAHGRADHGRASTRLVEQVELHRTGTHPHPRDLGRDAQPAAARGADARRGAASPASRAPRWFAVYAPAKTPEATVRQLNAAINKALAAPELRERFTKLGLEPTGGSARRSRGTHGAGHGALGADRQGVGVSRRPASIARSHLARASQDALLQRAAAERIARRRASCRCSDRRSRRARLLRAVERDHERAVAHRLGREQGDVLARPGPCTRSTARACGTRRAAVPFTKVTTLASITSFNGDVHAAFAGTQSPRKATGDVVAGHRERAAARQRAERRPRSAAASFRASRESAALHRRRLGRCASRRQSLVVDAIGAGAALGAARLASAAVACATRLRHRLVGEDDRSACRRLSSNSPVPCRLLALRMLKPTYRTPAGTDSWRTIAVTSIGRANAALSLQLALSWATRLPAWASADIGAMPSAAYARHVDHDRLGADALRRAAAELEARRANARRRRLRQPGIPSAET